MVSSSKSAEYLAMDLFHIIPVFIFNDLLEAIISPTVPDILFLIPIALTDGIVGGIISLFIVRSLKNRSNYKMYSILIVIFFILFQFILISIPFKP